MEDNSSLWRMLLTKSADSWLKNKRETDQAEGLWRIHDDLYDVTDFIQKHPGGQFWLEATQGTDVTEAFETHHVLSSTPQELLKNFYVRKAKAPRNSQYTFEDGGFYQTLKKNVRGALEKIPRDDAKVSDLYTDGLMGFTFVFAILSASFWSYGFAMASGIIAGMTVTAAHNYCHRRNNFRMLYIDLCGLNSREFRIIHVLSHHFYPNSVADVQVTFADPFIVAFPQKKSFVVKYLSWFYAPLLFFPFAFQVAAILRFSGWIIDGRTHKLELAEFFPLALPLTMYFLGGQSLLATISLWLFIISMASLSFALLGFTNSHVHPDVFIEGDTPRSKDQMDWGINQLDTVCDRYEVTGNQFLVLVSFGDHALHHLFPTLDHGLLQHLYPVAQETMRRFKVDVRMVSQTNMFTGYFKQLAREKRNPNLPNLLQAKN